MKRKWTKPLAMMLAAAMMVVLFSSSTAQAAKKKGISLNSTSLKLKVKKSKKIKIKTKTKTYTKTLKVTVRKPAAGSTAATTPTLPVQTAASTVTPTIAPTMTPTSDPTANPTTEPTAEPTAEPTNVPVEELIHYNMTCSDDGKKLLDQSGKGNDAELEGVDPEVMENQSLFLDAGAYIKLPEKVFTGQDTFTISIWLKSYSGSKNTSAMFVGTKETLPVSYWLLNTANLDGRMKSVMTNSVNATTPWTTEVGISPSVAGKGVTGPVTTERVWNHYVTVITPESITGYFNGTKVGSSKVSRKFSDFGNNLATYIGKSSYDDPTWAGYVREVQVYQGVKTDDEIKQLYEDTKVTETGEDNKDKGTETDVFIADRADPYIIKGNDGYYYFTASYPMRGATDAEGYDRIVLRRSETLEGLKDDATEKTVWDEKDSTTSHRFIWAPELHYIGGKWYLYYAGSGSSNNTWDINCRVLMCRGDDPYNDEWEKKGKFQAASGDTFSFTRFSLDMTYFECNGKHYVIWAQQGPASNLYMAEIDPAEPWKAKTKAMLLTKPEYYWECQVISVNEGPSVLIHDGKVIVAYSASATGPEYCIGFMYADETADLLDINSWTKQKTPALTSDDLIDEYGPGHNSFTKDEEGNDIFVYHSRGKECYEGKCGYASGDPLYDPCRSARIRKVVWGENGLPILNK